MERRRGLGFGGILLGMMLVIALAAASGIIPFRQVISFDQSVELARAQRDALIAENQRLEQQIAALQTDGEVERLAREQFGLVMPGETAVVAVPVEATGTTVPPSSGLIDHEPWWRTLWNFITGRDLVDDE